ncbi:MAG TPA: M56 family metallopeptidase [Pirellulales bacterium]|nr:M56 family metallopeptidase [Pirellulales bacterium]
MNALGISLLWTACQVTVFCLAGQAVYLIARRRHPAWGAAVACGVLVMAAGVAALSISPWPRWWTARSSAALRSAATAAAITDPEKLPAQPSDTSSEDTTGRDSVDSAEATGALNFLSRMFDKVPREWSADSRAEHFGRWRWPAWLAGFVLAGAVIGTARLLFGLLALTKLLRDTRPVTDPSLLGLLEQLREQLRCRRPIELREMTAAGGAPAVLGWRCPIILLPAEWRTWNANAQRGVLAHETTHVAHSDFPMWLLAQAALIVNFYNPVAQWLAFRLRLEQELAADACGAVLTGGTRAYAAILAQMALRHDQASTVWAGRPFFPTRGTLMRRIEMLQRQTIVSEILPSRFWPTVFMVTLALVALGIAGVRRPANAVEAADRPMESLTSEPANDDEQKPLPSFDDSYLPSDAIAVMSFKSMKVADSDLVVQPTLLSFPFALGFGITATDTEKAAEWEVDEVTIIGFPEPGQDAADSTDPTDGWPVGIYRMHRPYEPAKLRVKLFGEAPDGATETTCHGHRCFRATSDISGSLVNYLMVDDRTIVVIRERDVAKVLASDPQSHPAWYDQWQKIRGSSLAVAFDSAAVEKIEERPEDSAEEFFWSAIKDTSLFLGRVDSTPLGFEGSLTGICKSPEQAVATSKFARNYLTLAGQAIPLALSPSTLPEEYQSLDVGGSLTRFLSEVKINTDGTNVTVKGKIPAEFVGPFAAATKGLLARQTEELQARDKRDEQTHIAKLGRLVEALNSYYDAHGHYPPAAAVGADGKTLHSWRVELLPYLGEQSLFDSYRLDEPWDSEHNKPLVERIPSAYGTSQWSAKGHTDYFVVTGNGTLFDTDQPTKRESITDAPGETILVLQSNQKVPWTKPVDIETSADHNTLRPFRGHGKGFYAAFADGTVRLVSKATDPASIRAMFTKAGGDEVKLR